MLKQIISIQLQMLKYKYAQRRERISFFEIEVSR
jgi:hypothetical protein